MIAVYRRIPGSVLGEVFDDPTIAGELLFDEDDALVDGEEPEVVSLDRAWHGLHYLLTEGEEDTVAEQVVLGGQEIGDDVGFGPVRYLLPGEVAAVAAHLDGTPFEVLAGRFDADRMNALGVYPEDWDDDATLLDDLALGYAVLVGFFAAASERGDALLLSLA
jgi:hypothetical protein